MKIILVPEKVSNISNVEIFKVLRFFITAAFECSDLESHRERGLIFDIFPNCSSFNVDRVEENEIEDIDTETLFLNAEKTYMRKLFL